MKKRYFLIIILIIFLISCHENNLRKIKNNSDNIILPNISKHNLEIKEFPAWLNNCTRFKPIFDKELKKYPSLNKIFDLSTLFSLVYHESMCNTKEELEIIYKENNSKSESWKGGIMQVDGCWRWENHFNCSTVKQQIENGIEQLNLGYSKVQSKLIELNLSEELSNKEKLELFLISYNRGYYVANDALEIYSNYIKNNTFIISGITTESEDRIYVNINCTEKDVCMQDYEMIDITKEFNNMASPLWRALLISCRKNYGLMHDSQGDYCLGEGYGLMYPKAILNTNEKIRMYKSNKYTENHLIPH